uniref:NADH-ubiquinone oxidoreductase chain 6 n=1 Tax=Hymenoptera sp. 4 GYN-2021 TaxID=2876101 RepID=A0A977XSY4_9HYME|nr:NADH dehydrogenase subunit 6 [Hymenoptera sp. 4 GYN-2021]
MMKILMFISLINGMMIYSCKTPLSMGMIILIQTFITSLMSGMMIFSYWYSYILFLIMLGGLLILFIYVSSLSPNQNFFFNKIFNFLNIIFVIIILIYTWKSEEFNINSYDSMTFYKKELESNFLLKMSLNKLYNKPYSHIMLIMINYLLFTLFIVVKIIKINLGPLRKYN